MATKADIEARIVELEEALRGVAGDEPPISDLTVWPWSGCSYCGGPHFLSPYIKRLQEKWRDDGYETADPDPLPGEDDAAPITEHTDHCPWARARAALASTPDGGEGA